MKSTTPGLAPLRTVEVTTKVVIHVGDAGPSLEEELGRVAMEAMLRGDILTLTPFQ